MKLILYQHFDLQQEFHTSFISFLNLIHSFNEKMQLDAFDTWIVHYWLDVRGVHYLVVVHRLVDASFFRRNLIL